MNHLVLFALALSALLALSGCGADGQPLTPTTTGAAVGVAVGSGGPSAAVGVVTSTQPRPGLTLTGGMTVGVNR